MVTPFHGSMTQLRTEPTAESHEFNQEWYAVVMTEPANPAEEEGFRSWRQALEANKLAPGQIEVLQDMVTKGEAETLLAAAVMLDWKDGIIHPAEHLYGF
jgi:ferric-dicitrate binding protein FerR (iron transport regulator)